MAGIQPQVAGCRRPAVGCRLQRDAVGGLAVVNAVGFVAVFALFLRLRLLLALRRTVLAFAASVLGLTFAVALSRDSTMCSCGS